METKYTKENDKNYYSLVRETRSIINDFNSECEKEEKEILLKIKLMGC